MSNQPRLSDTDWIKQSFIVDEKNIDASAMRRRIFTMAAYKFADTTIGGNQTINPPPQFTRWADIKRGGMTRGSYGTATGQVGVGFANRSLPDDRPSPSYGMGRYYSEAIDDNGQSIMMSFGVPEYNSLISFFSNFYDPKASALARTGRADGMITYLAEVTTQIVTLPLQLVVTPISFFKWLAGVKPSKFYYLKPTMPLYWDAVGQVANAIAANMGLIPSMARPDQEQIMEVAKGSLTNKESYEHRLTEGDESYHAFLKDVYKPSGGIDIFGVAGRYQRLANNYMLRDVAGLDNLNSMEEMREYYQKFLTKPVGENGTPMPIKPAGRAAHLLAYLNLNKPKSTSDGEDTEMIGDRSQYVGSSQDSGNWIKNAAAGAVSYARNLFDYGEGVRHDGLEYVSFRVDHQGTVQESFSSQTSESNIAQQINSTSSQARSSRFDFAEGNLGDGVISGAIEGVVNTAKSVVSGVASGLQISGIAALAGSAFVDIPKRWDSSSAQMPQASYNIELRSPYGNKLSRFQNLIIPLAMLLAGALPLAAGRRAYTSPFLCQVFSRGRCAIRLGIIDSLSITRGTGNIGWTPNGEPLGIDVSFSISDLSTIMAMPLSHGFSLWDKMVGASSEVLAAAGATNAAEQVQTGSKQVFEDDSLFDDYLAVLGSMSTMDQVYPTRKWKYRRIRQRLNWEQTRSPSRVAAFAYGSTVPGRILQAIALGTDRSD